MVKLNRTMCMSALLAVVGMASMICTGSVLETPTVLNHILKLDNGKLAVGAVNHIYVIDGDLKVLQNVSTGPVLDSKDCLPTGCTTEKTKVPTDNHNKILAVHDSGLITCGNVYQGTCEIRPLDNISDYTAYRSRVTMVAANTPEASTVGVVVPGKDALCVGVTFTRGNQRQVSSVPAISTRKLSSGSPFQLGVSKLEFKTPLSVLSYKFGFHIGKYTYFLFEVPGTSNSISKIARICDDDPTYYSYIEITLQCKRGNTEYDAIQSGTLGKLGSHLATDVVVSAQEDVLVTVFNKAGMSDKSAICIYKFTDILTKINENGNECFQYGRSTNAFMYSTGNRNCRRMTGRYRTDYSTISCAQLSSNLDYISNSPIVGTIPVSSAFMVEADSILTSVAIKTVEEHTVAYAGTPTGVLKKIHLKPATSVSTSTFKNITLGNSSVMQDMVFDARMENLYVMSGEKLHKVPTYECDRFTSCRDCVAARDPHCGWCTLENKCSLSTQCQYAGVPKKWYPYDDDPAQCILFSKIEPTDRLSRNADPITLTLTIAQLLDDLTYTCVFANHVSMPATRTPTGVRCDTPDRMRIPEQRQNDHIVVPLSVNSTETGTALVIKNFTFFSCESLTMCTSCTQSKWGCHWCIFNHKCVHASDNATCQPGIVSTDDKCPRIDPSTQKIVLPSGFKKKFVVKVKELPNPMIDQTGFVCKLNSNDVTFSAAAVVNGNEVTCEDTTVFSYVDNLPRKDFRFSLVWNGIFEIDNLANVTAELYKCPLLGPQCGICHSVDDSYRCAWNNKCVYLPSGDRTPCPTISIKRVSVFNTTIEGGTKVTLVGTNLGYSAASVKNAVTLAGVRCESIDSDYVVSKKITCRAGRSPRPVIGEIQVEVDGISGQFEGPQFEYKDPVISSVYPKLAPKSGGTSITIKGSSLDAHPWNDIKISVSNSWCQLVERTDNKTICLLNGTDSPRVVTGGLNMEFGHVAARHHPMTFHFTPDPTISSIYPVETFVAGGREITITGRYFTSIQEPKMFVRYRNETSVTMCKVHNEMVMSCPSPAAPTSFLNRGRRRRDTTSLADEMVLGFFMDNVMAVRNLENFPNISASDITYVPNPLYHNFTEKDGIKILKDKRLTIKGENLELACTEEEVIVKIGNELCKVTSLAKTELGCIVPELQPEGIGKDGRLSKDVPPNVTVSVGNLVFHVGSVRYYIHAFEPWVIGSIAGGVAVLVIIIIAICVVSCRRSSKAQREYKKMQIQLDTLESNVRNECKLAFAELQTDMSDLTSDLVATGIPFLDYDSYIFKVLFPGQSDHPTRQCVKDEEGVYAGMDQFEQLILNKHFLLILIRTLEEQKSFVVRDKANVASLLMVALLDKMEYATEILRTLLGELIDKYMEKKHPKLMLRRTESVVEKLLTHWLSICMYSYIQESPGRALFIMFKSIKHQVEKGPVDAVTGDARYALSEDRLLREKIEPHTLTLEVVLDNGERIPGVKVLDCDSVTQVKEKMLDAIYKNTAYSQRPSPHEAELEWRQGRGGHLTLADDDLTTVVEDSWKKLNTLDHYKVQDEALMALVPKQHHNGANKNGMDTTSLSVQANTPLMSCENGAKCWHLVKSDDMMQRDRHKAISEIFLTRLLSTKGTLQKFIDDLFQNILAVGERLPPAVKYLFDFLDESARQHGIVDPEVVYTWKSNSLPLRFWVNIIKNPDFVFDIKKSAIVDSSLSVIAGTLMDSCSTSEHRLGKDSPTNKLLFAKDIPTYKKYVENFYTGVQQLPSLSEQEMHSAMVDISRKAPESFHRPAALKELYEYVMKYEHEIMDALEDDQLATSLQLSQKLRRVEHAIHGPIKM